jgi:hypothetical protein
MGRFIISCNRASDRVAGTASLKSGIGSVPGKMGNIIGQLAGIMSRSLGRSATAAMTVLNSIDPPRSLDVLLPLAAIGALLGGNQARLRLLNTVGAAQVARAVSTGIGTGVGRLSRNGAVQTRNLFNDRVPMQSWPSRLTPALNALDIQGLPLTVQASRGQMFESRGKSWHLGVTTVKTGRGERTLGHLQSLAAPSSHYYFNRALPETAVAGIIGGQREFEPKHLPGFAGEVTEVESLVPALSQVKKRLIQLHVFLS